MSEQPTRVRVYHPASGNVIVGDVYKERSEHIQVIPDGIGEVVSLHREVWVVTELPAPS